MLVRLFVSFLFLLISYGSYFWYMNYKLSLTLILVGLLILVRGLVRKKKDILKDLPPYRGFQHSPQKAMPSQTLDDIRRKVDDFPKVWKELDE